MAYIGNTPAEAFSAFQKQDFSTSATTSYTLDHPVANQNEIALFINFVRQEPTTAYTASGTSLTLTSATSSSDDMYCVYLGKAVQTVNPPSGSVGSSQVAASIITGQTAETSIATDDTVLIHDTSAGALRKMTRANFVSGVGGTNTPSFLAYLSSNQVVGDSSYDKIQFNTEDHDSDNAYDNSTNYRFTPQTAGKYLVYGNLELSSGTSGSHNIEACYMFFYKNGSVYARFRHDPNNDEFATFNGGSVVMDFNGSTDYLEGYVYLDTQNSQTPTVVGSATERRSYLGAFKLIGV